MADDAHTTVLSKETFYSNLNGTSKAEISLVLSILPASVFLRSALYVAFGAFGFREGLVLQFLLDLLILNLPLCLSVTLLSGAAPQIVLALVVLSLTLLFTTLQSKRFQRKQITVQSILQTPLAGRLPFISNFRVLNNYGVTLGILAVDFVVFPRRYAKAETFGTGIMDGGVGAYVLMNAIVSPEARGRHEKSGLKSVIKSVTSSIPLLIIGFGRLASVKGIDYHEHASEYGIHWNFFFTLAATKILCTLILVFIPVGWSALTSISLAIGYQYLLNQGLQDVVLHGTDLNDSREGLFNANREGLVSSLGYVAIYFAAVRLGQYLLQPRSNVKDWFKVLLNLALLDVIVWLILMWVESNVTLTSRRLANLPYVLWNVAYCTHVICSFLLIDIIFSVVRHHYPFKSEENQDLSQQTSLVVSAIGRNQLLYFFLANLMTGLINIGIDTIHQSNISAFSIIMSYLFILHLVIVLLHKLNITTKFW